VMEYRKNYIAEIVTGEETVGASMGLSASVEISTRGSSRPLAPLDAKLLEGYFSPLCVRKVRVPT
jgi:hypothetical protein